MNNVDTQYLDLLHNLLGAPVRKDRTGVGVKGIFYHSMRFDLQQGFPLLTTKRVPFKSVLAELLWFISGSTNNNDLLALGCTIWNEWADDRGDLGAIYGRQWRNFGEVKADLYTSYGEVDYDEAVQHGFDQIDWVINEIKLNPTSRRLYVTSANPNDRDHQALDCCHNYFQFQVSDAKLNCYFQMRSTDVFLGLPFNIASYALLTHMVAQVCGLQVGELVYSGVDVHLYLNHIKQAKLQLKRAPYALPQIKLNPEIDNIFKFTMNDVELINYQHHDTIRAEVAV